MNYIGNITLVKKVTKIIFEDKNKYEDDFARQLAFNNFKIHDAYQSAFKDVAKVKASALLQDVRIWQVIFDTLLNKDIKNQTDTEQEWIESYQKFIDQFEISPFEAFSFYVENHKNIGKPIAEIISDNPVQDIMILAFLYKFFDEIEREYFYSMTKDRLKEEIKQVELTAKHDIKISSNFEATKKMLRKNKIFLEQILKCE